MSRRLSATIALVCLALGLVLVVVAAVAALPQDLVALAALVVAGWAGWQGLVRSGVARLLHWLAAVLLVIGVLAWFLGGGLRWTGVAGVLLLLVSLPAAKHAFGVHVRLPAAPRPQRSVVVYNVKSGGGKAVQFHLADEARSRGITPRELHPGEDWEAVVRGLVADGADALAAAGGDGTQALVATIAAEHDLPFACIPAGTRNHFALDLGVDRDDVVGALDAFVDGGEKRVDLAEVGGRVFVNNVSLGLYAEAVQQEGYREAKIRTLLATVPAMLGPGADGSTGELRWRGADGTEQRSAAVILVSNNAYRLGRAVGSGTRPRLDGGTLGIAVMGAPDPSSGRRRALVEWSSPTFAVSSDRPLPLGVDGEALVMPSPLEFRSRPAALRVRIAPQHPGASPSAGQPTGLADAFRTLTRMSLGRS